MRRRRKLLALLGCLVAIIGVTAFLTRDKEPRYQGHPLHAWLVQYRTGPRVQDRFRVTPVEWDGLTPTADQKQAAEAIRHIGTNALPWLLQWLQYTTPAWKHKADAQLSRLDHWRISRWITRKRFPSEEIDLHGCAMLGLAMLGPEGNPKLRELLRLAEDSDQQRAYQALGALSFLGKDGIEAIMGIAGNPDAPNQLLAIKVFAAMRHYGTNVSPAIPLLARLGQDPDPEIAWQAVYSLCNLGLEPEICFPVFTNAIASTNTQLKIGTIHHIGYFGPAAVLRPLVPSLLRCLEDPDTYVQRKAMEALTNIDPKTLLGSTNVQARLTALNQFALVGTGLSENEVLPHVLACLTDSDQEVRRAATNALQQVTRDLQRSAARTSGRSQ